MLDSGNKKIILFGCGILGHEMLERLGADNVLCFCDNNESLHGTTKWGKDIFSLEYIKNNYNGVVILICARIDKAYKIICQLDENEVYGYWCYPFIKNYIQDYPTEKLLELFYNKELMVKNRMMFYKDKISELENQLDYMKRHTDIKTMKPATGALRKRQLDLAEFGSFISNALGGLLNIKPFLCAGNLIGHIRHNGFIPWDDDLDFGLIRKEYELLRCYFLENQDSSGMVTLSYDNRTEVLSFDETHEVFYLSKKQLSKPSLAVEFFSFDYYMEDYEFNDFKKDAQTIKINLCNFLKKEEKINYVREQIKKNKYVVEKSKVIFYGFDDMGSSELQNKRGMIPEEVLFPLKRVKFEGKGFWIPNEAEKFLSYIYENVWDFPEDTGIIKHALASEDFEVKEER